MSGQYQTLTNDSYYGGVLDGLAQANNIKVSQRIRWIEALTDGCCEQKNKYKVFNMDTEAHLFTVVEDGDCCNRMCCAPHHTFDLNIIPPGLEWTKENYASPVLMERPGCCDKCLGCFTCGEMCQNVAHVWKDAPGKQSFRLEEKLCNGCTPEIVVYAVDGVAPGTDLPMAVISGPGCFGGCYELCSDFYFDVTTCDENLDIKGELGNIAEIRKVKPQGCMQMCLECCTDIDNFTLKFRPEFAYNNDPNFKACILSALLYLDYMFFEMDNGICSSSDNGLTITLFNCYCAGCICPCCITLNGNGGE